MDLVQRVMVEDKKSLNATIAFLLLLTKNTRNLDEISP